MKRIITMTSLVLTALLFSAVVMAADLPAQEGRLWAPAGDLVGQENHATLGVTSWDPHGNKAKYAEDWQQEDDLMLNALFGYKTILANGRHIQVRGFGQSGMGTFAGHFSLDTKKPGRCKVSIDFRNFNSFSDMTSEMRASSFGGSPAPPALDTMPSMGWKKANVKFNYNLGKGFALDLGFDRLCKDGSKGSLLRGGTGSSVPNVKLFDTKTNEFSVGLGYQGTSLGVAGHGYIRTTEGDRAVGDHSYTDDSTHYRAQLDATYKLGTRTTVMGLANTGKLETTNTEYWNNSTFSPVGEAKTSNGRLAVITSLGTKTTARLSAGLGTWNTDTQTDLAGAIAQASTRERTSQDLSVSLSNNSLDKTRLRFDYRFRNTQLEGTVAEDNLPGAGSGDYQSTDQDRQSHQAKLRAGVRLSRTVKLKAQFDWRSLTVDEANTYSSSALFYTMGDRQQDRLGARLALQTRPSKKVKLDVGFQGYSQNFERNDVEGVKTSNSTHRAYAGLNVLANDRLTFVGTGSYGIEKYEVEDGPAAGAGMGPLTYEGKTLRFAPGAILQVGHKMELEAHYEGIRFEDPGDAANEGNQLNSDLNRILLRAGYRVGETMKVTASYRRHEFDENRWDDYIMDLYSLSLSGRF
ncbi:MAG: hypothetical protein GY780_12240 [bacterium]|nr:hypothetical protein [bacterium]